MAKRQRLLSLKDRKEGLHRMLIEDLSLHISKEGLDGLKSVTPELGEGRAEEITTFRKLCTFLENRAFLGPDNYDRLKQMFESVGLYKLIERLDEAEKNISQLGVDTPSGSPTMISPTTPGSTPMPNSPHFDASHGLAATVNWGNNDDLAYPLNEGAYPGLALIINNFTSPNQASYRKGTIEDEKRLVDLFQNTLKFRVRVERDVQRESLGDILTQCQAHLEHEDKFFKPTVEKYNCFVCVILSHGNKDGPLMVPTDNKKQKSDYVSVDEIVDHFKPDKVKSLKGKPKIFIIQACRGSNFQQAVDDESQQTPEDVTKQEEIDSDINPRVSTPVDADIVIQYSTTKDYVSLRNKQTGSWFIEALTDTIFERHKQEDLMSMMTRVNKTIAQKSGMVDEKITKQMPCIVSTLTGRVYFN
ncbi:unnamed protein product [Owenia fusiformis]|uniref:Uncharacterized protein n=1 Tax=Owenia fusiformis TaxID=6347 RepID=A0A8J1TGS0_OWEFU|nr:unnamed protein product [Owenia fusiformis]